MTPLKKVKRERRTGICGGSGAARTPTYSTSRSSRAVVSVHSKNEKEFIWNFELQKAIM
jgi:hypothetical protein